MKIVINSDYSSFGLSIEAKKEINKIGCPHSEWIDEDKYFGKDYDIDIKVYGSVERARQSHCKHCEIARENGKVLMDKHDESSDARTCPVLIQVVEKLKEKANKNSSTLKVIEIPDGIEFIISEYDGIEWVAEKHRTWC